MIYKCKYYVECDNDCGEKLICLGKRDLKQHLNSWITYRLKNINPFADYINSQLPSELHFCCQSCAENYFDFWAERKDKYERL